MNGLGCSEFCRLFLCPPCPSKIAAKVAFLPPEPSYTIGTIMFFANAYLANIFWVTLSILILEISKIGRDKETKKVKKMLIIFFFFFLHIVVNHGLTSSQQEGVWLIKIRGRLRAVKRKLYFFSS